MYRFLLRVLVAMFSASCMLAYGQIDSTARSLDEIERISFGAGLSPAELPGIEIEKVLPKTVKTFKPSGEISLSGMWLLAGERDSLASGAIDAKVPGTVHAALFEAGLIPDPTIGMNDSIAEKQSYKDWWFCRKFHYDKNWKKVMLSFDGVANKCTVYLNGKKLGSHEGMMGGPDYLLGDELKKGENELLVHLDGIPNPVPGPGANPSWTNTVVANCVYGWHYVKIPSLGIWADVKLKEVPEVSIQHPFIFTRNLDGSMRLVVNIAEGHPGATLSLNVRPKNFSGKHCAYQCNVGGLNGDVAFDFKIDDARLWWPNGAGEQPLYTATVTYDCGNGVHDVKTLNFGVRTIEMQPVGGEESKDVYNWKFVVNGRPICIKGANWCLIDYMLDLSPEHYRLFLDAAKEQNLNLLRAWGGGLVETDTFYDMCDEMGLMVMQEWPTAWNSHLSQNFDVLKETIDRNTFRIRSHPSLVMWAGGNESANPFGDAIDYMGRVSVERDGTRPFHRGEPWGGSGHNHDSFWLDLSMNNALNMSGLFFGEFGMPSMPVRETVDRYLDGETFEQSLQAGSRFAHHTPTFCVWGDDMRRLMRIVSIFVEPSSLDNVILGSQIGQALATRRAMERARVMFPDKSSGAVYYKVNDVFPGLSWGTVDYYGAKKPVHYFVKRSTEPCMPVIIFDEADLTGRPASLMFRVLNENGTLDGKMCTTTVELYDYKMKKIFERRDTVVPDGYLSEMADIVLDKTHTTSPLLYFKVDLKDDAGNLIARNWYIENFYSKQDAIYDAPECRLSVIQQGNVLEITNSSEVVPAVGVDITVAGEAHTLDLSDNMLWIDPGESVTVSMNTDAPAVVSCWNIAR